MKYFYYIDGLGRTQGPVKIEQLMGLVSGGAITQESLVVVAGETQWQPLSQFRQQKEVEAPTIDPDKKEFYLQQRGQVSGPLSAKQLERMQAARGIAPSAQISQAGGDKWVPVAAFGGGAVLGFLAATFMQPSHDSQQIEHSQQTQQTEDSYDFGDGNLYTATRWAATRWDTDGDGAADAVTIDTNHDGRADVVGMDTDGDGRIDAVGQDVDHDGKVDVVGVDTDGDGDIDVVGADTDGDGAVDLVAIDTDNDGRADVVGVDTDGDGDIDVAGADTDGDGAVDLVAIDTNNDGRADVVGVDTDGDGDIDVAEVDTDSADMADVDVDDGGGITDFLSDLLG